MKMHVEFFDNNLLITKEYVNVIEIENKKYFYRFINSINDISNSGYSDEIKFFEEEKELNLNGKIKLIIDYFNLEFDSKKNEKEINKYVNELFDEENKNNIVSNYNKIIKIYNKVLNNIDLPLSVENEVSIESITKLLKISVQSKYDLLDNLLLIIDLEKTLQTNNLLFFVNLKQYLNKVELIELYKYSIYNGVNIILIDSQAYGVKLEYERKLIIDNSLEEYML